MSAAQRQNRVSPTLTRNLGIIAGTGTLIAVAGIILAPERAWPSILLASYYLVGLGLGGAAFIAVQYVSNAGWSVGLRRVPEAVVGVLPAAALLMLATMAGVPVLYSWSHASTVAADHLLQAKAGWLSVPFFLIRVVVYLAIWLVFSFAIVKTSRRQDANGDLRYTLRNRKLSAAFLIVFGLIFTLASMDWIMSLQPKWYSTIFGIYNISGLFLNGLAAITILVILLRRWGPLQKVVTESHLHDLGRLIFAFSTFWMYIWFSQYLLIWYANIPEEVVYFTHRESSSWVIFTGLNVVFNWLIPFLVLLPQWTKRNDGVLLKVCVIVMIGHWIDLFWMILPPFMPQGPELNVWEIGPPAAAVALFFMLAFRSFAKNNAVPSRDPMLVESLHYHDN